eukprot:2805584-Pyramimonas_sp.AAC.1
MTAGPPCTRLSPLQPWCFQQGGSPQRSWQHAPGRSLVFEFRPNVPLQVVKLFLAISVVDDQSQEGIQLVVRTQHCERCVVVHCSGDKRGAAFEYRPHSLMGGLACRAKLPEVPVPATGIIHFRKRFVPIRTTPLRPRMTSRRTLGQLRQGSVEPSQQPPRPLQGDGCFAGLTTCSASRGAVHGLRHLENISSVFL